MMRLVRLIAWFLAAAVAVLALLSATGRLFLPALLMAGLAVALVPPAGRLWRGLAAPARWLVRPFLIVGLLAALGVALPRSLPDSIYRSPEIRDRFHVLYDEKMQGWPVPFEDIVIESAYGPVHVIASGPAEAPPMLLLHASGMSSWSWRPNIAALTEGHRVYAIDLIGDAGKSEYRTRANIMRSGRDQAELYDFITESLGIGPALVVGASEGGFIATNFALHHPERVKGLVLIAPMGYAGALKAALRITFAQLVPLRVVHDATFRWAFSDEPSLMADYAEWFPLLMTGTIPAKVPPLAFSPEERQSIAVPVLYIFGARDNVIGDPERARAMVADVPGARVEIIDAGHLVAAERPDEVNALILQFASGL